MKEACKSLKLVRFFCFFSAEFFFSQIFLVGIILSHRFHRYTQIFFIMIFLHRISRMNRKAFLFIGLLTEFRGTLAAGQWLAPYIFPCCFLSRRFRWWRRFFFVGGFCPTDFTDLHRFSSSWFFFIGFHRWIGGILAYRITHGISQNFGRWPMARALYILLLFFVTQISLMTQIFLCGRVLSHRFHRFTQIFYGISGESLCPVSGGICNDRTGRICENPWVIVSAVNLRIISVSSDE